MRYKILLAVSTLFASLVMADPLDGAAAATYSRNREQQRSVANTHQPWIWEARSGDTIIWIAGCIHVGIESDVSVFQKYLPFYQKAECIYFEASPDSLDSFETRRMLDRRGFLKNHQAISSKIPSELWSNMQRTLGAQPALLAELTKMEPWMAAFTLCYQNYAKLGLSREYGLESYLTKKAIQDRKPIGGLEQAASQILALADIPNEEQQAFLRSALRCYEIGDQKARGIRKAWIVSNEKDLRSTFGLGQARSDPSLHRNLITGRNEKWVQQFENIGKRFKSSLVIVGIEHMIGDSFDIPSLLAKSGFTLRRCSDVTATPLK